MELVNYYSLSKSLHLIGMVSWMAGMFYLVRIMVYHAQDGKNTVLHTQFLGMEWKAYRIIIRPAIVITWTFGVIMLCIQPEWLHQPWMQVKLLLLVALTIYTHRLQHWIKLFELGQNPYTHVFYRAMNELPTIMLVSIVFLAVFKLQINFLYLFLGVALFSLLIYKGIKSVSKKQDAQSAMKDEN